MTAIVEPKEATFVCKRFGRTLKVKKTLDSRMTAGVYNNAMEQISFVSSVPSSSCRIVLRKEDASLWLNDTSFTLKREEGISLARDFELKIFET